MVGIKNDCPHDLIDTDDLFIHFGLALAQRYNGQSDGQSQ